MTNVAPIRLLTVADMAALLGISEKAVYQRRHRGGLPPAVTVGSSLRWRTETVLRWLVENEAPEPMAPSRLEVHDRLAEMSPSSVSSAVPVKPTESPSVKVAPFDGAVIVTVGAVLELANGTLLGVGLLWICHAPARSTRSME